jgi:hypothetical protein
MLWSKNLIKLCLYSQEEASDDPKQVSENNHKLILELFFPGHFFLGHFFCGLFFSGHFLPGQFFPATWKEMFGEEMSRE